MWSEKILLVHHMPQPGRQRAIFIIQTLYIWVDNCMALSHWLKVRLCYRMCTNLNLSRCTVTKYLPRIRFQRSKTWIVEWNWHRNGQTFLPQSFSRTYAIWMVTPKKPRHAVEGPSETWFLVIIQATLSRLTSWTNLWNNMSQQCGNTKLN